MDALQHTSGARRERVLGMDLPDGLLQMLRERRHFTKKELQFVLNPVSCERGPIVWGRSGLPKTKSWLRHYDNQLSY